MRRRALVLAAVIAFAGPAAAQGLTQQGLTKQGLTQQSLTIRTLHGAAPANADRVLISGEDGNWLELTGVAGVYEAELSGPRYALAITCFGPYGPNVAVYRFLAGELSTLHHACAGRGDVLSPLARFRGELRPPAQAAGGLHHAVVRSGPRELYSGVVLGTTSFSVPATEQGGADLLALYGPLGEAPSRAVMLRDVGARTALDAAIPLDFSSDDALELETYELSVDDADGAALSARLVTCAGTSAPVGAAAPLGAGRLTYAALPQEARRECDRYERTAMWLTENGKELAAASVSSSEPAQTELRRPAATGSPHIETVGTDPLRARLRWRVEQEALYHWGNFSDGFVTWTFVQSAAVAPSITLPPWGADVGVPDLRGGEFTWSLGVVRSAHGMEDALHAHRQSAWMDGRHQWREVTDGVSYEAYLTSGEWAPHSAESPRSR